MTRETKVGLLVGLGVILLIGIIVSDHLSDTQRQSLDAQIGEYANHTQQSVAPVTVDNRQPTVLPNAASSDPRRAAPHQPIPLPEELRTPQPQDPPMAGRTVQEPQAPEQNVEIVIPQQSRQPEQQNVESRKVIHRVNDNESLWQIAEKYYGDGNKWKLIRDANPRKVRTDGSVGVGADLYIPNPQQVSNSLQQTSNQSTTTTRITEFKTVEVGKGDTLEKIAKRYLGSGKKWEELYNLNKSVIGDDPDRLALGMKLKVPN